MAVKYEVEYFQLNVSLDSVGDAAVALLVERPTTGLPTIGQKLISAVLIDLGSAEKVLEPLKRLIERVEKDFILPDADKIFRFDSIVITHWDEVCCHPSVILLETYHRPGSLFVSRGSKDCS